MASWQSYADFAHLFDALLKANGITDRAFASQYAHATGTTVSSSAITETRQGLQRPSYQFIADLADHALLSLAPEHVHSPETGASRGNWRVALFAAAGLIEVTPESISQWNQEVLASWQRRIEAFPERLRLNWKELMQKLLEFHTQGERRNMHDIALAANAAVDHNCLRDARHVTQLLRGKDLPTAGQRQALARAAGLSPSQIGRIEAAVEDGSLAINARRTHSQFSALLGELLERLRAVNISQRQLIMRTVPVGETEPRVSEGTLSGWKHGIVEPTLSTLRALAHGLERCHPVVTKEEIGSVVSAAGFSVDDLAATTHDIISRIDDSTRLKPLLTALRNAADLDVPMSLASDGVRNFEARLKDWESKFQPGIPLQSELRDLLECYNHLLRKKGETGLSEEEIQRVMEVAQRDREDGLARGFQKRAREIHPILPRSAITPDFDGGPSR